jgi:cation diffusion facilitator CzcD-associated flavoprotein CzcO
MPVPNQPRVAVIGAGFGGIVAAIKLQKAGVGYVVFERSEGVGGTWWDNRYPGAETDAASHLYAYSFAPYDWTRTHVRRAEIQGYLEHVAESFGVLASIRFKETVEEVLWDDVSNEYVVCTSSGDRQRFQFVVSAVGLFAAPKRPVWPGLEGFEGEVVHTADWDSTLDITGKKVAVVGTGSSAAQVVPTIASDAESVTVYQRQPGWVLPKGDRDFTRRERRLFKWPMAQRLNRMRHYLRQERREWHGAVFRPGSRMNRRWEAVARRYLAEVFADRPDLAEALTPDYPFAGKRTVVSSEFYPSLLRKNVRLVPRAVVSCTSRGIVDSDGAEQAADVIVLATGFEATSFLASLAVKGRGGVDLRTVWGPDPFALAGLMVPGFPNFFIMYGPNTNGGLTISNFEHEADFIVHQIQRVRRSGGSTVDARSGVVSLYNRWVQHRISSTAWVDGSNYFASPTGRIVTQWPEGAAAYALVLVLLRRIGTKVSRPGVARHEKVPAPRRERRRARTEASQ